MMIREAPLRLGPHRAGEDKYMKLEVGSISMKGMGFFLACF
jgi:hypothetical protein